ncbi:MAG TPA: helix-turn-helix transcriptional regulator [Vicinamibacterales bacterium]|nr:helix-turn-helix transcriptional regulator [Vicinamibacterales bacterium]
MEPVARMPIVRSALLLTSENVLKGVDAPMTDRSALYRFVDNCQVAILSEPARSIRLRLEHVTQELLSKIDVRIAEDQFLVRAFVGRTVGKVVVKRGMLAGDVALAFAALAIDDSLERACWRVFTAWSHAETEKLTTDSRLRKALVFIRRAHRSPKLTLRRTAAVAGLSPWHFSRLLHQSTGLSYKQHVRGARVESASLMLRLTKLSAREIASRVGYLTAAVLTKDFRAIVGKTPTAYRRVRADGSR